MGSQFLSAPEQRYLPFTKALVTCPTTSLSLVQRIRLSTNILGMFNNGYISNCRKTSLNVMKTHRILIYAKTKHKAIESNDEYLKLKIRGNELGFVQLVGLGETH